MSNQANNPLTFREKFSFGAGDFSAAITTNLLSFYLLFFFTNIAGLSPSKAGLVLLVGKFWDAINDPIVGILSDRTKSPLGRRLPWMIYGAIPFGVTFALQWFVPSKNPDILFWYYVIVSVLFNTFYTIVNLPYTALTPELTQDYHERTSLNSFRFTFSIGGSILSLVIAIGIFAALAQKADSCSQSLPYSLLGGVCAVLSIISIFGSVAGIKQRVQAQQSLIVSSTQEEVVPFGKQIGIALRNRAFLYVIGIYFFSWLSLQITASIIPYFVTDWMKLGNTDFTQVLLTVQGTALIMLFFWNRLSISLGKKAVFFLGIGLWLIGQIGLFLLQPGQIGWMYFLAFLAGMGVSTAYLIPWSMIPDVTDLDEWQTGTRREGIFYAFMVLLQKLGLAIGLFLLGTVLEQSGFIQRVPCAALPIQPASALSAIRIAIGPIPAISLVLSLVLAYYYPITQESHAVIQLQLRERKLNALTQEAEK